MSKAPGMGKGWVRVCCALTLAACSAGVVPHEEFDAATHIVGPLYSTTGITELTASMRSVVPGPIRVVRLHIFPHHAVLEAQDPQSPAEVNLYRFRGGNVETEPVANPDAVDADVFGLEAVALDAIPRIVDEAVREFGEPGADVTSVSIGRAAGTLRISASVQSLRASGSVDFDATGTLLPSFG